MIPYVLKNLNVHYIKDKELISTGDLNCELLFDYHSPSSSQLKESLYASL